MELTTNRHAETRGYPEPSAATTAGQRVRVLAIDDKEDFLVTVKEMLEPLGFEVHTAANPVKALEVFSRNKDRYQLVLLDYYLPQLDGVKTLEWLRKLNPDIKVIIVSGAEELRLRQIKAQHPIDGYLHKPFRAKEALDMIQNVMRLPSLATE